MSKLMTMRPLAAFATGIVSATLLIASATVVMLPSAVEVANSGVSSATKVIVAVGFTVLAPALVAAPWIYAVARGPVADVQLAHLGDWLKQTSWIILTFLFVYMAASLVGGGLDAL